MTESQTAPFARITRHERTSSLCYGALGWWSSVLDPAFVVLGAFLQTLTSFSVFSFFLSLLFLGPWVPLGFPFGLFSFFVFSSLWFSFFFVPFLAFFLGLVFVLSLCLLAFRVFLSSCLLFLVLSRVFDYRVQGIFAVRCHKCI